MNDIAWRRNPVGVAVSAVAAIAFALVLSGSSFIYPSKGIQLGSLETASVFGTKTTTMFEFPL
jgi:hypothetical protein